MYEDLIGPIKARYAQFTGLVENIIVRARGHTTVNITVGSEIWVSG